MKPLLLLARLCDPCHYSWTAARANSFPKILFIKNFKLSDRMIKQLLNSVIAKYRDLSVSRRSIICRSRRLRQIIDLLATDKSRYFAQPRPIIGNCQINYSINTSHADMKMSSLKLIKFRQLLWRGILDKNVIGSYHKVHYIEFACILSYRTRYAVMSYSVMLYCNRNTVLSYSVTLYRNQNSIVSYSDADVSYPVVIYRNLYAVVSYSVT